MEKIIRKGAIYGFLVAIGLAILLVDYKHSYNSGEGVQTTYYVNITDYVVSIVRYGVVGSFIGAIGGWNLSKKGKSITTKKTYYLETFFTVLVLVIIASLIFKW